MNVFTQLMRVLDRVQRGRWFRVLASVVVVGASCGLFGSLLAIRSGFDRDYAAISTALLGDEADRYAMVLRESGEVVIDGETFRGPVDVLETMIDEDGNPIDPRRIAFLLLRDAIPDWAPTWLLLESGLSWSLMFVTIAIGLAVVWMGTTVSVLLLLAAGGALSGLMAAFGWDSWVAVPIAMATLIAAYLTVTRLLQLALSGRAGWMSVAHTLLSEVARTRLALGFVVTLLVALPLLPLTLDREAPIDQLVQAYLARSIGLSFAMSAVLVLLIGCSTVCFDIRDRHIWHLVTKPLGRTSYLFGKWVGVVLLGGVLLAMAGAWSWGTMRYLDSSIVPQTRSEIEAAAALDANVLVARSSMRPQYEELAESDIRGRVDQILADDPEYQKYAEGDVPLGIYRLLRKRVFDEFDAQRRTVQTVRDPAERPWTELHFEGLQEAKRSGRPVRLEFRLLGGLSDEHDRRLVGIALGDNLAEGFVGPFIPTMKQYFEMPASVISDDGTLDLTLVNLTHVPPPAGNEWIGPVNLEAVAQQGGGMDPFAIFWMAEDMEVGYPWGSFGGNFLRAFALLFLKLCILAAIACAVATTLSFPVAVLVVFTVYIGASVAPWLATAIPAYGSSGPAAEGVGAIIQSAIEWAVRTVASGTVYVLRAFGELQPTDQLVGGRLISWVQMGTGLLLAGIWGGGAMVVGWFILSRRQLAIYSGGNL